jgi:hypothetical protein
VGANLLLFNLKLNFSRWCWDSLSADCLACSTWLKTKYLLLVDHGLAHLVEGALAY